MLKPDSPVRSIELVVGDWILYCSTFLGIVFLLAYIFLSKDGWRKTPIGRGMFFLILSFTAVMVTVALANILGPDFDGRATIRVIAFASVPFAIGNMLRLLFLLQIESYRLDYPKRFKLPR